MISLLLLATPKIPGNSGCPCATSGRRKGAANGAADLIGIVGIDLANSLDAWSNRTEFSSLHIDLVHVFVVGIVAGTLNYFIDVRPAERVHHDRRSHHFVAARTRIPNNTHTSGSRRRMTSCTASVGHGDCE